jgi:O-antigen/teichoic acid export membrane protein
MRTTEVCDASVQPPSCKRRVHPWTRSRCHRTVGGIARLPVAGRSALAAEGRVSTLSDRVFVVFATRIFTTALAIFNGFLLARLLGPAAKGETYLVTLPPTTIMVLIQFGLPVAFSYFAGRSRTEGLVRQAIILTGVLSAISLAITVAILPLLTDTFLRGPDPILIVFGLCALPILLLETFATSIAIARKAVLPYAVACFVYSVGATILVIVLVGVLGLGVPGAVTAFVLYSLIGTSGYVLVARRATAANPVHIGVRYSELFRYGLPMYAGSVTMFFSKRADVFLLAAMLADPAVPLGNYSIAVTMAEMVFFFSGSVESVYLPHVAGSSREDSDRHVAAVSRITLLLTATSALALVPIGTAMVNLLLPAFDQALPALDVLLPGVVSLSVGKVVGSYVAGLGRTVALSVINVGGFALNIVLNLVLIPRYGIVGAAVASLVSYTATSLTITVIASRLSGTSALAFWTPRREDASFVIATSVALFRGLLSRRWPGADGPGGVDRRPSASSPGTAPQ